jgi:uncharacterized coiled-coil protein SlyX
MEQLYTAKFWHEQWDVVMMAPWLITPLLCIAGLIGWIIKGAIDGGEIKALRERRELAHDKYEMVAARVTELEAKVAEQDSEIADLRRTLPVSARVNQLATSNTEIRNLLTDLASATTDLGVTLTIVGPRGRTSIGLPSDDFRR